MACEGDSLWLRTPTLIMIIPQCIIVQTRPKDSLYISGGYAARHAALRSLLPGFWALMQGETSVSTQAMFSAPLSVHFRLLEHSLIVSSACRKYMPKMGVTCINGLGTCDMALSCLRGLLCTVTVTWLGSCTLWARMGGQDDAIRKGKATRTPRKDEGLQGFLA